MTKLLNVVHLTCMEVVCFEKLMLHKDGTLQSGRKHVLLKVAQQPTCFTTLRTNHSKEYQEYEKFRDSAAREKPTSAKCGDPFKEDDLVVLNGSKEDVEKLQKDLEERRSKAKSAKKSKKSKDAKAPKADDVKASSGPSGETSKATKTPAEPATGSKRSIQEMTDKSEIYKSLFTSHSTAKRTKDQLSNWVTHTPYHF
ncbi:Protein RTF2 -like protein [Triplophysa tibetana]|uniref:Protein RTF2-like protein n=1 Tax=Triplophysa tibetana TaxID=1572043 RepID=A0A5A9MWW3_9TELE|nr:Protein RTF2 -like protein [Triplophysa tibetana]